MIYSYYSVTLIPNNLPPNPSTCDTLDFPPNPMTLNYSELGVMIMMETQFGIVFKAVDWKLGWKQKQGEWLEKKCY